jgi:hypothetical protein
MQHPGRPNIMLQLPAVQPRMATLQGAGVAMAINNVSLPKCCNCEPTNHRWCIIYDKKELQQRGTLWSPLHFQNCFSREILHRSCSKLSAGYSSTWYPSSEKHSQASARQIHWRWYGYINHHSPTDFDGSTVSRHWRGQVYSHYESNLWTGYAKIWVTIRPIRSCNTAPLNLSDTASSQGGCNNCLTGAC